MYTLVDGSFSLYLLYLSWNHLYDWRKQSDEQKIKNVDFRNNQLLFKGCMFLQYLIAWACFYIGKYKVPKICDLIVHIFILKLCISYYFIVPFNKMVPIQYALRSVIICLRCSMVVAIFGVNGIIDVIAGLVMPLFSVMLVLRKVNFN